MKQEIDDESFGQNDDFTPTVLSPKLLQSLCTEELNEINDHKLFSSGVSSTSTNQITDSIKNKHSQNKKSSFNFLHRRAKERSITCTGVSLRSSYASETDLSKSMEVQVKELTQNDKFECFYCQKDVFSMKCKFCQGKQKLTTKNNIVKFFEYIMNFKLGLADEYVSKRKKRTQPNKFCQDFFTKNPKNSLSLSIEKCITMDQFKENCSMKSSIHNGYECDGCEANPIRGVRYHCRDDECENDYDLCQECFRRKGHRHEMIPIEQNGCRQQAEAIQNLLSPLRQERSSNNQNYLKPPTQKPTDKRIYSSSIH